MDTHTPCILVCDDEMPIRQMIAHKLKAAGYRVVEARDGSEGLAAAEREPPALVLTDLQMPVVSGLELAARLKGNPATCTVPVLMLTARGYVLSPEQLAKTNIACVIGKPFGLKALLDRVAGIVPPPAAIRSRAA